MPTPRERSDATLATIVLILPPDAGGVLRPALDRLVPLLMERFAYYEVILVDDSGTDVHEEDARVVLATHAFVHYLRLHRSIGEELASYAGLDQAIGDHVVIAVLGQDPMEAICEIMVRCQNAQRIVFGRALNKPRGGPLRRLGQALFQRYAARVLGVALDPYLTRLVAMPREVVNVLLKLRDPSGYLSVQIGHAGLRAQFFDYHMERPERWLVRQGLGPSVARAVRITAQNSVHPLRLVTYIGLLGMLFDVLYVLFIIGVYFWMEDRAPGWVALSMQQAIQFFFICAFFSVISEYLGQLMISVKDRPLYFVADRRHSNVLDALTNKKNVVDA